MSYRLEAWTLPGVGTFEPKVRSIDYSNLSIGPRFNGVGQSSFSLPYGHRDIPRIINPETNEESLMRVFVGSTNVHSFYSRRKEAELRPDGQVAINGPNVSEVLDKILHYPFDWAGSDVFPASETTGISTFLDTVYGGDNLLANPGFEQGLINEVQGISHDYRPTTTLAANINDTQTSFDVADGSNFPASDFRIVVNNEWMWVTTRTGNTLSGITRGYLGTTAASHTSGDTVEGGGYFTLTYGAATTGRLEWNATPDEIEFELEALGTIIDVAVDGEGTVNVDPWLVEFIDPGEINNPILTANTANLTGSGTQFNIVEKVQGGRGDPSPWTKSYDPNTNFVHGGYAAFSVGSNSLFGDPAHTGDKALGIQPEVPTPQGEDNYPGAQQIIPVDPAGIYQASVWVYPTVAGTFSLVMRDLNERLIGTKTTVNLTAGSWQQIQITNVVIPVNVSQALFRVAAENPADAATFWVDDAEFNEGYEPDTVGQIMINARTFATAQSRDTGDWLDTSSFSATLDSSGAAWTQDESIIIPGGSTWRSTLDEFSRRGYEWRVRWNGTAYALEIYNNGNMGTTVVSEQFTPNRLVRAFIRSQSPDTNVILGRAANNVVDEVTDATLVAAHGRRESFQVDTELVDAASLLQMITHQLNESKADKHTAKLVLDSSLQFGVHYDIGDFVTSSIPNHIPEAEYRVRGILITVDSEGQVTSTVDIGKYVHQERLGGTTSSVTSDAVNWLLRQQRKVARLERATAALANVVPEPQEFSTEGTIPWLVASSIAPQEWKDIAGAVCDGTNDEVEIEAVLQTYQYCLLSPGVFYVEPDIFGGIALANDMKLQGSGIFETIIEDSFATQPDATSADFAVIGIQDQNSVSDLSVYPLWSGVHGIHVVGADTSYIERVYIEGWEGDGVNEGLYGGTWGILLQGCDNIWINDCVMFGWTNSGDSALIKIIGVTDQIWIESNVIWGGWYSIDVDHTVVSGQTASIWIKNNWLFNPDYDCIRITTDGNPAGSESGLTYSRIVDNVLQSWGGAAGTFDEAAGIRFVGTGSKRNLSNTASDSLPVSVNNNSFEGAFGCGVRVEGRPGVLIENNIIEDVTVGISVVDRSDDCVIANNRLYWAGHNGLALAMIEVETDCDRLWIYGNTLRNERGTAGSHPPYGIAVRSSDCDDTIIVGNDLRNSGEAFTTAPILNSGTGTLFDWPNDATYGDNFT